MKTITIILIGIVILFLIVMFNNYAINSHENDIRKHFTEQNQEVKTCEYQITTIESPFYYCNKGQFIFKVELVNGETWWVRTGVFSNDYEKDK